MARPVSELTIVGVVKDVISGIVYDGTDAGHIYLPIRPTDPNATAVLVRPRSERDLGPDALQRILKEVVPDAQTFEAMPLEEMRATQVYPLRAASWVGQQSSRMAGLGAVFGGAVAFAVMRTLSAIVRFPTVSLVDVVAFGAGFAAVMAATAIAAYQPARRATRVDPAQALRAEG